MANERYQIERISPLATRSLHRSVLAIDRSMVAAQAARAADNPRKREIHCFHQGDDDTLHRMLNAIQPDSYVRPHRHLDPPKAESILILSGSIGVLTFDDDGRPDQAGAIVLSEEGGVLGADIRAGVWHTFLSLEAGSVVFEVKPGPYYPLSDKHFAPWAPEPDTPDAAEYLLRLRRLFDRL
jgi:cupin fold WbuC family metalloprotein